MILFFYFGTLVALAALIIYFMEIAKPLNLAAKLPKEPFVFTMLKSGLFHVLGSHPERALAEVKTDFALGRLSEREFLLHLCFVPLGYILLSSFFVQSYVPVAPQVLLFLGAISYAYRPMRLLATYLLLLGIVFILYPSILRQAAQLQGLFIEWPSLMWVMDRSWLTAFGALALGLLFGVLKPWTGLGLIFVWPLTQASLLSVPFAVFFLIGEYLSLWLKGFYFASPRGRLSMKVRGLLSLGSLVIFVAVYPTVQSLIPYGFGLTGAIIFEAAFAIFAGFLVLDLGLSMTFMHFWAKKEREPQRQQWVANYFIRRLGASALDELRKRAQERMDFMLKTEGDLGPETTGQVFAAIEVQVKAERSDLERVLKLTKV